MDFSETVIVYGVKVGRCRNLNENMNLYEYQRSRSFIWSRSFVDLGQGHSHLLVLNFFSLETTKPIEAKFHVEPPLDGAGGGGDNEGLFKCSRSRDQDGRNAHIW